MATALSVNLNKVALIRNSREGDYPSVITFAQTCLNAKVQGLTVHPRPDQRHIRPSDVFELSKLVKNSPGVEFNIEGNPFAPALGTYPGLIHLAEQTLPNQCTLVPDTQSQLTSDHGFDLKVDSEALRPIVTHLQSLGIRVSLFMGPVCEQIELAKALGAERIELYTGPYAEAFKNKSADLDDIFEQFCNAAKFAQSIGLGVNAGHDLNLENLGKFLTIPNVLEVSIGHALTVDSLYMGLEHALAAYQKLCNT